jgi:spore coat protein JC
LEMIATMINKLTKDATVDQLKAAGVDDHYVNHDERRGDCRFT